MPRAERDLAKLYEEIDAEHADQALLWYRGLKKAILCLARFPNRCPATPESRVLRHVLYGRGPGVYRVIYRVLDDRRVVEVLHVRPGARTFTGLTRYNSQRTGVFRWPELSQP